MKHLLVILSFVWSISVLADGIESPGKVFYKMPNGEIVEREVTLSLPERGQGDVVLSGGMDLVADRFFTKQKNERTIFFVIFSNFPGSQAGDKAVFKGTYTRGSNLALYYGDIYLVRSREEEIEALPHHRNAKYVAGFSFRSEIASAE